MTDLHEATDEADARKHAVAVHQAWRKLLRLLAREIAKKLRDQNPDDRQHPKDAAS